MNNYLSIIIAIIAIIINSVIFGSVLRNSKHNKTKQAYLIFLTFIIFWMPLSFLFLNFTYSLLSKKRDKIFNFFIVSITLSIIITLFSNKVLLSYKDFNFGTMAFTGSWFLPITFLGIIPASIYSLYLIGKEANIFYNNKKNNSETPFVSLQLKILFFGSIICLIIAVTTNIFFDEVLGYSGELHLASLSLSIQSLFLLPAIIKYNFLNQPMETLGDELYLNAPDAVLITNKDGIILNLNKSARKLFNLKGSVVNININKLFSTDLKLFLKEKNIEAKTTTDYYVTLAHNAITRGNLIFGNIITIRDITERKKTEKNLLHLTKELTNAQEVASLGSFTFDIKKNEVTWSDKLYQIYGRDKKSFIPTRESFFNEIVHPESRQIAIEAVENAVKNNIGV